MKSYTVIKKLKEENNNLKQFQIVIFYEKNNVNICSCSVKDNQSFFTTVITRLKVIKVPTELAHSPFLEFLISRQYQNIKNIFIFVLNSTLSFHTNT